MNAQLLSVTLCSSSIRTFEEPAEEKATDVQNVQIAAAKKQQSQARLGPGHGGPLIEGTGIYWNYISRIFTFPACYLLLVGCPFVCLPSCLPLSFVNLEICTGILQTKNTHTYIYIHYIREFITCSLLLSCPTSGFV